MFKALVKQLNIVCRAFEIWLQSKMVFCLGHVVKHLLNPACHAMFALWTNRKTWLASKSFWETMFALLSQDQTRINSQIWQTMKWQSKLRETECYYVKFFLLLNGKILSPWTPLSFVANSLGCFATHLQALLSCRITNDIEYLSDTSTIM